MSEYAIGIGGTGARCVEALVHVCAAGLGPDRLTILMIDPDKSNGNLERSLKLVETYRECQKLHRGKCDYVRTQIETTNPSSWSPFDQTIPTLDKFFESSMMSRETEDLYNVLYTPEQRQAELHIGFLGRPSMGAAVFGAAAVKQKEPWGSLRKDIANRTSAGEEVRVFAFGSVFGGTGAAGLPTIPRLLKHAEGVDSSHVRLGTTLLLPYFSFINNGQLKEGELCANAETFLLNAAEALQYYGAFEGEYDRMYVLGSAKLSVQENFSRGGNDQRNRANLVEFIAALGARDFYKNVISPATRSGVSGGIKNEQRVAMLGHSNSGAFGWEDVPDSQTVKPKIAQFARFCFAFLDLVFPRLEQIKQGNRPLARTSWYVDLFERPGLQLANADIWSALLSQRALCVDFLKWAREVQYFDGLGLQPELFAREAIPDPENGTAGLMELHLPRLAHDNGPTADQLWRSLCVTAGQRREHAGADGIGLLQRVLYDACV